MEKFDKLHSHVRLLYVEKTYFDINNVKLQAYHSDGNEKLSFSI